MLSGDTTSQERNAVIAAIISFLATFRSCLSIPSKMNVDTVSTALSGRAFVSDGSNDSFSRTVSRKSQPYVNDDNKEARDGVFDEWDCSVISLDWCLERIMAKASIDRRIRCLTLL